jgi:hypothetical protein
VKHVWVDTTDTEAPVVDPALLVLKEITGSTFIILYAESVPGNIEYAMLVTKFREWGRFDTLGIDLSRNGCITVEKEYMIIERTGAAITTMIAPETDLQDNRFKPFSGVCKKLG